MVTYARPSHLPATLPREYSSSAVYIVSHGIRLVALCARDAVCSAHHIDRLLLAWLPLERGYIRRGERDGSERERRSGSASARSV